MDDDVTPPPVRVVSYLNGVGVAVVGSTAASDTAVSVLGALGAQVRRIAGSVDDVPVDVFAGSDVVVSDRVREGCDATYVDAVSRRLDHSTTGRGVWVTLSSFGLDGPAATFTGSELVCAAAGGLLAAVSDDAGHLYAIPGDQALQAAGQVLALAALHGLSMCRSNLVPVHLDVSGQEAVAFCSIQQEVTRRLYRCGGTSPSARYSAPAGVFRCADGLIHVVVIDDHQFAGVARVLGREDWIARFPTVADRAEHAVFIDGEFQAWSLTRPKVQCESELQTAGVPATAVRSVEEVACSEQFRARGWAVATDHDKTSQHGSSAASLPGLVEIRHSPGAASEGSSVDIEHENVTPLTDLRTISDLHVVEVTNVLAGPLTGAILGAMGADVVRLEDLDRLDVYRRTGPFVDGKRDVERAAYYLAANYSKRSVAQGVGENPEFVRAALGWGHVLVENVGGRRLARLGIDQSSVGTASTGLAVSISGFGRTGPAKDFKGYGPNVHSFAGLLDAIERTAQGSVTIRTAFADYCTAVWAATISVAWWLSGATDKEEVDLSMAEVVAAKLPPTGVGDRTSVESERSMVVALEDGQHLAISASIPDFAASVHNALRGFGISARSSADPDLGDVVRGAAAQDVDKTVRALQEAGIAAYLARTPDNLGSDMQLAARDFFLSVAHPVVDTMTVITLPWKIAGEQRAESTAYRAAPLFGGDDAWAEREFGGA
jgi:crotonobetainyl-CoA:carnitine CoA-transferase CaiB-like acyl-CoA transferase